jgi:hypothetical protein
LFRVVGLKIVCGKSPSGVHRTVSGYFGAYEAHRTRVGPCCIRVKRDYPKRRKNALEPDSDIPKKAAGHQVDRIVRTSR